MVEGLENSKSVQGNLHPYKKSNPKGGAVELETKAILQLTIDDLLETVLDRMKRTKVLMI